MTSNLIDQPSLIILCKKHLNIRTIQEYITWLKLFIKKLEYITTIGPFLYLFTDEDNNKLYNYFIRLLDCSMFAISTFRDITINSMLDINNNNILLYNHAIDVFRKIINETTIQPTSKILLDHIGSIYLTISSFKTNV